jgi:adenosylcobinamide-GDP ribazoletransferase
VVAALGFLTRIPVPGRSDPRPPARAAAWFPLVGLVVGGVMAGVHSAAALIVPGAPATVLALLAAVLVTGGLHEDGLADVADGLGAHVGRERRLEIMRDPRVGTYGALALIFSVALPLTLLAPLNGDDFARAAMTAHVLSRCALVPPARLCGVARRDGAGASFRPGTAATVAAIVLAGAIALATAGPATGAVAIGAAALVVTPVTAAVTKALGGITGDVLGAVAKLAEVAVYVTFAAS